MEYFQKKPSAAGVAPSRETHRMIAHGTVTAGTIYAVDPTTATAANNYFATDSKAAPAATNEGVQWCVALASGVAGASIDFGFRGVFDCLADATGIAAADKLSVDGSGALDVAATGEVIIAIGVVTIAGSAIGKVWFDGNGFSSSGA